MPALVALLLAGALVACGEDRGRARLRDYVRDANAVQQRWAGEFRQANDAYLGFARGTLAPAAAVAALQRAETDIRAARDELADLQAPGDARTLHTKLVRLFDMNLAFAHDTAMLAAYQRGADAALAPLERYDRALRRALARARRPAPQARALARFARRLARTLRRLRALTPPPVLRVAHGDQIRRLDATRVLAARLTRALERQDAKRVARLIARFRARADARRPRRTLARRAIAAYGRRYHALARAAAEVQREYARLDRELR